MSIYAEDVAMVAGPLEDIRNAIRRADGHKELQDIRNILRDIAQPAEWLFVTLPSGIDLNLSTVAYVKYIVNWNLEESDLEFRRAEVHFALGNVLELDAKDGEFLSEILNKD